MLASASIYKHDSISEPACLGQLLAPECLHFLLSRFLAVRKAAGCGELREEKLKGKNWPGRSLAPHEEGKGGQGWGWCKHTASSQGFDFIQLWHAWALFRSMLASA